MQEVMARHGKGLLLSDAAGVEAAGPGTWKTLTLPQVAEPWSPILYAIPAQLLAYHHAIAKGTNGGQPPTRARRCCFRLFSRFADLTCFLLGVSVGSQFDRARGFVDACRLLGQRLDRYLRSYS